MLSSFDQVHGNSRFSRYEIRMHRAAGMPFDNSVSEYLE
jgi:hypothetical protein